MVTLYVVLPYVALYPMYMAYLTDVKRQFYTRVNRELYELYKIFTSDECYRNAICSKHET